MRFVSRGLIPGTILVVALTGDGARAQAPIDRIREAEIKADLFALAGDAMRGREGGTLDEMTASMWIAERARAAGLQPAGDNGTYFQFFPLERFRVSASSPVTLGGKALRMGRDVIADTHRAAPASTRRWSCSAAGGQRSSGPGPVGQGAGGALRAVHPPRRRRPPTRPPAGRRRCARGCAACSSASRPDTRRRSSPSCRTTADQWERVAVSFPRGTYGLDPDGTAEPRVPARGTPLLYVRESALGGALAADARLVASIFTDSFSILGEHRRQGAGPRSRSSPRVRALQRAPGSRRRALRGQRRRHLERRRRQRDDRGGAAGDRPRDGGVTRPALGALHLARRRRARADGIAVVREASRPCR